MKIAKSIVLSLLFGISSYSQDTHNTVGWTIQERILLKPSEFTLDFLVQRSRKLISSNEKSKTWGVWYFAIDKYVLNGYPFKPILDHSVGWWKSYALELISDSDYNLENIAELRVIRGNAVLKAVINGVRTRLVIAGQDPLIMMVGQSRCELLHYSFPDRCSVDGERERPCSCKDDFIQLCVKCTSLSTPGLIEHVATHLRDLVPSCVEMTIGFRTDEYFYDMYLFPTLYAFSDSKNRSKSTIAKLKPKPTIVKIVNSK